MKNQIHIISSIFVVFCFIYITRANSINGIKSEALKVLLGDTISLECPQDSPTWFFRSRDTDKEDLIVTRHGIINADYKHKFTCHGVLKHKIITINKAEVDDEGVYTCLYTINTSEDDDVEDGDEMASLYTIQQRHVFNMSVYTLISDLSMNVNPITITPISQKFDLATQNKKLQFEVTDNVLTVKENDEFSVNCAVERSKPPAIIQLTIGETNNNNFVINQFTSLISTAKNVIQNNDKTYKTVSMSRLRAHVNDHGKVMECKAENGLSNQKWENRKLLNVLFAPVCNDPPDYQYFIGINQTVTIECRIKNANPNYVKYSWYFHSEISMLSTNQQPVKENVVNEGFVSRFKMKPTSIHEFGAIKCLATNEIGTSECTYELKLGGIPNPPFDCTYTLKNTSAIVFCQLGFHQGDPDIYCYLLRKSDNGVYHEHTRSRDSCSFLVNDVHEEKLNEFWVYSSNKFGHNKDSGVHLTIGELKKAQLAESTGSRNIFIVIAIIGGCLCLFTLCCFCFKLRKSFNEDIDSIMDNDAYQIKTNSLSIDKNYDEKISTLGRKGNYGEIKDYDDEKNQNLLFELNRTLATRDSKFMDQGDQKLLSNYDNHQDYIKNRNLKEIKRKKKFSFFKQSKNDTNSKPSRFRLMDLDSNNQILNNNDKTSINTVSTTVQSSSINSIQNKMITFAGISSNKDELPLYIRAIDEPKSLTSTFSPSSNNHNNNNIYATISKLNASYKLPASLTTSPLKLANNTEKYLREDLEYSYNIDYEFDDIEDISTDSSTGYGSMNLNGSNNNNKKHSNFGNNNFNFHNTNTKNVKFSDEINNQSLGVLV